SLGGGRRLPPRLAWCSIDWDQLCLLQPLGSGGFGSVYKATYHGATVAVKQVKKNSKNRLASRQSFWAELNYKKGASSGKLFVLNAFWYFQMSAMSSSLLGLCV
uniref:Serine/threonine-protein kinase mos n=1 Tax=Melopsittacus undulatus TaxID=13146 RepID=A0A8V5FT75_MELUD